MTNTILFFYLIHFSNLFYKPLQELKVVEGFYVNEWEQSAFYEIIDGKLKKQNLSWVEFHLPTNDKKILEEMKPVRHSEIYMHALGFKNNCGSCGHLASSQYHLQIFKIINVDSSYSMKNFIEKNQAGKN